MGVLNVKNRYTGGFFNPKTKISFRLKNPASGQFWQIFILLF